MARDLTECHHADDVMRASQDAERELSRRLTALHEILNEICNRDSVIDICRQAVELGSRRLGFDRLSVWLRREGTNQCCGTYGIDESGNLRDETGASVRFAPGSAMGQVMSRRSAYLLQSDTALYDLNAKAVGRGTLAVAGLWDGHTVRGYVCTDNLLTGKPITEQDAQILALLATDIGHLHARKEATIALAESEQNFRALAENAEDAIFIDRPGQPHMYVNEQACKLTGYTRDELLSMTIDQLLVPEEMDRVVSISEERLRDHGVPQPYETRLRRKDGSTIVVEVTGSRTTWKGTLATIGIVRDITQRKQQEAMLRRQRNMLARAERIANIGAWELELDSGRVHWSDQMYRIFQVDPADFTPSFDAIMQRVAPEDRPRLQAAYRQAVEEGTTYTLSYRILTGSGEVRWVQTQGEIVGQGDGTQGVFVGVALDTTNRRRLERDILEISSRERQRIGRDLHDTLGQQLAGLSFLMTALRGELDGASQPLKNELSRIDGLVHDSLEQTRRIARGLSPVPVEEEGLAAALADLAKRISELFQVRCRCTIRGEGRIHDPQLATHLYYIAQEAVSNAVRHAQPDRVTIHLMAGETSGLLAVRNDGKPLPQTMDSARGLGLRIMRYRAELIGGDFALESTPNGRTIVSCRFPNRRVEPAEPPSSPKKNQPS